MHDNIAMIVPRVVHPKPIEIKVHVVKADNQNRNPQPLVHFGIVRNNANHWVDKERNDLKHEKTLSSCIIGHIPSIID